MFYNSVDMICITYSVKRKNEANQGVLSCRRSVMQYHDFFLIKKKVMMYVYHGLRDIFRKYLDQFLT